MKKIFKVFFAFALLFVSINTYSVKADDGNDLGDIFSNLNIKVNNNDVANDEVIMVDENTEITLEVNWTLDDDDVLLEGDYAKLALPEALNVLGSNTGFLRATIAGEDGEEDIENVIVGDFIIADNELKVIFNDELVGKVLRAGELFLQFTFDLEILDEDLEYVLKDLGGQGKDYYFKHSPNNDKHIFKDGKLNGKFIEYEVDINLNFEQLTEAELEDVLPDSLKYVNNSLEIYKLKYNPGTKEYSETGSDLTSSFDVDLTNGIKVGFGDIKSAYRIKYKTEIIDYPEEGYTNDATLTSNELTDNDFISFDKIKEENMIEKSGYVSGKNSKEVVWTVDINKPEMEITNAQLIDEIPAGLILDNVKVYHLKYTDEGSGYSWKQKDEVIGLNNTLPLLLGNIDSAYRVVITTKIDPNSLDFTQDPVSKTFENKATLKGDNLDSISDDDKVTMSFDNLVSKVGKDVTNFDGRVMEWEITLNKAKFDLVNVKFVDIIGPGQQLIEDSIRVNNKTLAEEGYTLANLATINTWNLDMPAGAIGTGDSVFGINLGEIDDQIVIKYRTKLVPKIVNGKEVFEEEYENRALLFGEFRGGEGSGTGGKLPLLEDHGTEGKLTVSNTFSKSAVSIDYAEKTFSWRLNTSALASPFTALTISDDFSDQPMLLMDDTIKVYRNTVTINANGSVSKSKDLLIEGTHYTLTTDDKSFEVVFDTDILGSHEYIVEFKTNFDLNDIPMADWAKENKFVNKGTFDYENKEKSGSVDKTANHKLNQDIYNQGKKVGQLDRENRKITWTVYANALNYKFTKDFVVTDTLSAGHSIDKTTMKAYKFSLAANGNIIKGDEVDTTNIITYTEADNVVNGFVATFTGGISHPVMFEFESDILGLSLANYENTADVVSDGYSKTYKDDVDYSGHDKFVNKNSDVVGNTVYMDNEINWTVTVNESLSHIKDAVFKDVLSDGLLLLLNTIKVNDVTLAADEYEVVVDEDTHITYLTIELGEISGIITVEYATLVVASDVKVSNKAALYSNEERLGKESSKEYNARMSSWGTGSGQDRKGSIEVVKVDENGNVITNLEAEFEVYYIVNETVKIYVGGETHKTVNGKLQLANLPYRTYYIREINAPTGFVLDDQLRTITLNSELLELEIENKYKRENVEAKKVWIGGEDLVKTTIYFKLYRNILGQTPYPVDTNIKPVSADLKVVWDNLEVSDINGNNYIYSVKEVDADGNDLTLDQYSKDENGLTVTNTYNIPKTHVVATKVWEGGSSLVKPTIYFKVLRNTAGNNPVDFGENLIKLDNGETSATWTNLDKTDSRGNEYTFSVVEVDADGNDLTLDDYTKVESGLVVTNTFDIKQKDITAKKVWVDGEDLVKPTVYFKLYRNIAGEEPYAVDEDIKELVDGTLEVIWKDQDITDFEGNEYTYSVVEVDKDGNNFTPEHYSKVEEGLTVTNTYIIPKDEVVATKVWEGGDSLVKPTIYFKLYRNIEGQTPVAVEAELKELVDGTTEVTWTNLETTDSRGNAYTYSVIEVDEDGNDLTLEQYSKFENGLVVTNTFIIEKTEIVANKVWVDGDDLVRPTIYFKLFRNIAGQDPYAVDEDIIELVDGITEATWDNQDVTDFEGREYTYTVVEVDKEGNDLTLEQYSKVEEGLTVTNTYIVPKADVVAKKEWVDGEELVRPSIFFKLYRQIEDGELEEVSVPVVEVDNESLEVIWEDLEETDINGNFYIYSVVEVDNEGKDYTPENYEKNEDGLLVINTYVSPKTFISVNKVWEDGENLVRPDVEVVLYQNGEVFKTVILNDKNDWMYVFEDLDVTDSSGIDYDYAIDEVSIENYGKSIEFFEEDNHYEITNTYNSPITDLVVHKVWVGGDKIKPDITIQLLQNNKPYRDPVILKSGQTSYVFEDVELTDKDGNTYEYSVKEINVPKGYKASVKDLTITNTYTKVPGTGIAYTNSTLLLLLSITVLALLKRKRFN